MLSRRHQNLSAGTLFALLFAAGVAPSLVSVAPVSAQTAAQQPSTAYGKWMTKLNGAETGLYGKWRAEVQESGVRLTNVRNGSRVYHFADGSRATETPDGRVTLKGPDGRSESRAADGTVIKSKAAKKNAKVRPTGDAWGAWTAFSTASVGEVPAAAPPLPAAEEPSITIAPNGSQYVTLSDGSVMSIPPAGLMPPAAPPPQQAAGNPPTQPGDVNTTPGEAPPATPTDLAVIGNLDGGFNLTWTDAATDEVAFEIERTPSFSEGQVTVGANLTQFNDAQDMPEVRYRVRANGVRLNSPWSCTR